MLSTPKYQHCLCVLSRSALQLTAKAFWAYYNDFWKHGGVGRWPALCGAAEYIGVLASNCARHDYGDLMHSDWICRSYITAAFKQGRVNTARPEIELQWRELTKKATRAFGSDEKHKLTSLPAAENGSIITTVLFPHSVRVWRPDSITSATQRNGTSIK